MGQECFSQGSLFQKSLKEALEVFINREIEKFSFAALIASFRDRILKKSGERLSDDEVEVLLTKMVELFPFLSRMTQPQLKQVVIQAYLAHLQAQLLEGETCVVHLLDNDKREDSACVQRLFSLVNNGLTPVAAAFRTYDHPGLSLPHLP